jgi:RNA polymerase sigma-70 factor (ECF subfamily)
MKSANQNLDGTTDSSGENVATHGDYELLQAYVQRKDSAAMELFYQRHRDWVYGAALRICGSSASAEDLVQNVFIQVLQKAEWFQRQEETGGSSAKGWLAGILMNTQRMERRSGKRRERREREVRTQAVLTSPGRRGTTGETDVERKELLALTAQALSELPEMYRTTLDFRYCAGLSVRETAAAMNVPEDTVYTRLRKGVELLRQKLRGEAANMENASLIALLPALIESFPTDKLNGSVFELARSKSFAPVASESLRGTTTLTGKAFFAAVVAVSVGGGVVVLAAVLGADFFKEQPLSTANSATHSVPERSDGLFRKTWTFNADAPKEFTAQKGRWSFLPNAGPDGSGCMLTDDFVAVVDLDEATSNLRLPLRIRWRYCYRNPERFNAKDFAKDRASWASGVLWSQWQSAADFHNIGKTENIGVNAWRDREAYVTERFVLTGPGYKQLTLIERKEQARLALFFRLPHCIDDLTVEEIRPEELPDVAAYLDAFDRIPPEKRTGEVVLPELQSSNPSKPVNLRFYREGSLAESFGK